MPIEVCNSFMEGKRCERRFSPFPVLEAHLQNQGGTQRAGMLQAWPAYLEPSFWGLGRHVVEDGPRDKVGGHANTGQDSSPVIWDIFPVSWDFFFLSLYNSDSGFLG